MEDISMRGAVVRISQDSMEAYLTLQPPENGEGYTLSELVRYIRTQRVTNGIDEAAIQEMIDGGVYMRCMYCKRTATGQCRKWPL